MYKYDRNYFKNTILLDNYFLGDTLVLKRFKSIAEIISIINKDFEDYDIRVKDYAFKDYYENDFQDYEIMLVMGNNEEDFIDITIYYATTRIGEKIITETSYEII
jgi:hypothetical protein